MAVSFTGSLREMLHDLATARERLDAGGRMCVILSDENLAARGE
jgi:hypothetical protein